MSEDWDYQIRINFDEENALHVDGEGVYPKAIADALEAELRPLAERGLIAKLSKHDTNPANNPQAPAHLR